MLNNRMFLGRFLLIGIGMVGLACQTEMIVPSAERQGTSYFPLEVGDFREYAVQEISYSLQHAPDTLQYLLREVVADSFPGRGGEMLYRLERSTRASDAQAWRLDSVWTARMDLRRVIVVENNRPIVKLVFPFTANLSWDGNALNAQTATFYELHSTPETLLKEIESPVDTLLAQSVTVVQKNLSSLVSDSIFSETYADQVGLFYKKSVALQYCAKEDCLGQYIIEYGRSYRQTLIAYGKE